MNPIFFDTEFIDNGKTVELISIGLVNLKGETYYAESSEVDLSLASVWVQKNVIPNLKGGAKPRAQIAQEIREFVGSHPQFWAWFGSYDWLCISQLYGTRLDVPSDWPKFVFDFKAFTALQGQNVFQPDSIHNALEDALWLREQMLPLF